MHGWMHGSGDRVQSFMQEHTDDITALAVTPCGKWVATGETGANPKVRGGGGQQLFCAHTFHPDWALFSTV